MKNTTLPVDYEKLRLTLISRCLTYFSKISGLPSSVPISQDNKPASSLTVDVDPNINNIIISLYKSDNFLFCESPMPSMNNFLLPKPLTGSSLNS